MKVFAVIGEEEKQNWQKSGHPFSRSDIQITFFSEGYDLKERLLKSGLPDILALEEDLIFQKIEDFVWDLREIKSWEKVQTVLIYSKSDIPSGAKQPNVHYFKKPVSASQYEEVIKSIGKVVSRRYPRKEINAPCSFVHLAKKIDCKIKDISLCGCRIEYDGELKIGSIIQLAFGVNIGTKGFVIRTTAKVVRIIQKGYGLSFLTMDGNDRNLLNSFIRG
ncbi:MAG: PilZ domain-containing protein [Thermoanaerobaculaceae bacterium]|nr:PilZ domain-containing protein [Thermoanaerobaculaceae bacterium]